MNEKNGRDATFRGNRRVKKKGRPENPPDEYERAYRRFHFGKPGDKKRRLRLIKIAKSFPLPPYSPYAQELLEELFLQPLREGNHQHFRNLGDDLKAEPPDGIGADQ